MTRLENLDLTPLSGLRQVTVQNKDTVILDQWISWLKLDQWILTVQFYFSDTAKLNYTSSKKVTLIQGGNLMVWMSNQWNFRAMLNLSLLTVSPIYWQWNDPFLKIFWLYHYAYRGEKVNSLDISFKCKRNSAACSLWMCFLHVLT